MKTIVQMKESIQASRDMMDNIIATAEKENRDLTIHEAAKCESLVAQVTQESIQLEAAQAVDRDKCKRKEQDPAFQERLRELGMNTSSNAPAWSRDSKGRGYCMLAKADKATDVLKPQAKNEFGHYVVAKLFGVNSSTPQSVRAELSTNNNSLGGFLVPERLSGEIIDLARARSVLGQSGMRTILMDSDNLVIPKLESDVTVATKAENAAFTASNMTFGARRLNTYTAGALVKMSRELAEDAPELLAEQLVAFMGAKMAQQVDEWGIAGTGSQQPLGILNRSEIDDTGTIGAIDWLDVAGAATAVRNANHEPNGAVLNTEIYSDLFNAEVGDGVNASRGWLNAPPTLASVGFLQTTNCPLAKMIVGDWTKYAMGMRTGAMVEATTQAGEAFERHQVWLKISMRFDFCTLDDSAFHILTGITS